VRPAADGVNMSERLPPFPTMLCVLPSDLRKRDPTTAPVNLTQIMCVGVLRHVRKDANGQGGRDHLTGGAAYIQWCPHRELEACSHAMFGRLARWRKDRIGGAVWYLDCELAEGYAQLSAPPDSRIQRVSAFPA
jgi:hypothetical protein